MFCCDIESTSPELEPTAHTQMDLEHMYDNNISLDMSLNSSDIYDAWHSDWTVVGDDKWHTVVIILYSIVILFGFFANLLIVVVIIRYKQLHTVTNIFICYLAIADVFLCVFNLPLQLHYQLSNTWMFGRVLCYVAMPTFGVPLFSSTLSILMIAVDRYMLIVHPFKTRMTNMQAIFAVVLIIIITITLSTPLIVYVEYMEFFHPSMKEEKVFIYKRSSVILQKFISYTVFDIFNVYL